MPHSLTSAGATALCLSGAMKGTSVAVLLVVVGGGLVRGVFGGDGGPDSVTVWGTREGRMVGGVLGGDNGIVLGVDDGVVFMC